MSAASAQIATLIVVTAVSAFAGTATAQRTVPVEEQNPGYVSHQFVGFTSATTASGIGFGGMNAVCQAEIPDSRMCTTREIATSLDPTPPAGGQTAWVLGEYELIPNAASTTLPFLWREKVSGNGEAVSQLVALRVGCEQFISSSSTFRTVVWGGTSGIFFRTSCTGLRLPVACCSPRLVPAGP